VLIADEIQCGLGRTGKKFAYQRLEGLPDIVIVAKPLAGGLPLGALLAREEVAASFSPGLHGSTFGGGPLTCAVGQAFLDTMEKKNLLANVQARGAELKAGLRKLAAKFDFIREVRGEGLIIGIDLSVDGAPFVAEALKQGLLINCTHDHILRLLPPFILTAQQVKEGLSKIESVLARTERPAQSAVVTSAPAVAQTHAAAR
jgi:acetylornithine/succinyldiaminopimelate/putrescine aminotransferase